MAVLFLSEVVVLRENELCVGSYYLSSQPKILFRERKICQVVVMHINSMALLLRGIRRGKSPLCLFTSRQFMFLMEENLKQVQIYAKFSATGEFNCNIVYLNHHVF